jgi:hypothetical protein
MIRVKGEHTKIEMTNDVYLSSGLSQITEGMDRFNTHIYTAQV